MNDELWRALLMFLAGVLIGFFLPGLPEALRRRLGRHKRPRLFFMPGDLLNPPPSAFRKADDDSLSTIDDKLSAG